MIHNTRSIFIPSLKNFIRFKEFTNEHLIALFRTADSPTDSIYTQWDIIKDLILDESYLDKLTIVDCFVVFLNWRINCISDQLVLNSENGFNDNVDLYDWLESVNRLSNHKFYENITVSLPNKTTFVLNCDLPTMEDFIEIYESHIMDDVSTEEKDTNIYLDIHTIGLIHGINGNPINSKEKFLLMELLPATSANTFRKMASDIKEKIEKLNIVLSVGKDDYNLSLNIIPSLIRMLCGGSVTDLLEQSVFMSKKCGISYDSFMKMTPMESQHIMLYVHDLNKENSSSIDEDEFEQIA